MIAQKESARKIIKTVKELEKPVIAGGPLFSTGWREFPDVDHFFLGEAENSMQEFLHDLEKGKLKKKYINNDHADIRNTVIPAWELLKSSNYNTLSIQFSRGCPFDCEFCDVVRLFGRTPRMKSREQVIRELESIYDHGWRHGIFFVDDNFIGNKSRLKKDYLPAIIDWQKKMDYPFTFLTQVSINLADDMELVELMVDAGFTTVFIGIETPDSDSLKECGKIQNQNRSLVDSIKRIQGKGLEVQGGFIVGFDNDRESIFQRQIEFIQRSGIVTACVGVLTALPETRLYKRLQNTKRLIKHSTGDHTSTSGLNFIPKMDADVLLRGYKKIKSTIYAPKNYYERIRIFLKDFKPRKVKSTKARLYHFRALFSSLWLLGFMDKGRYHFWRLIFWSLFKKPRLFPYAIGFSLTGIHFRSLLDHN
jgi:radical SAM superfamily enzyme YgiQ (UPF0313 family)